MKKKILIFSFAYEPVVGGAEVAVKEIASKLDRDFDFDMITFRFSRSHAAFERVGNVNVYRIGFWGGRYLFPFLAASKARALHGQQKYDASWAIMANYAGFAALFFKQSRPEVPLVLTLQEGDPIPYIKKRVRFVFGTFKKIFASAERVQAISHYLAGFARDMESKGRVEVVPNGTNVRLFSESIPEEKKTALRKELGILEGEKVIITTSRLVLKNAVGDVIDAMRHLPYNTKFLVLGVGELEAELKAKARANGLESRVIFLGFVPYEKLPQYLQISDVFCRPSLSEGLGCSFIEAMAAGLPIVATNVGGIPDFLFDGETGLFCEVQNPRSVAEKIGMLFDDKELHAKIQKNARALAEKYDWDDVARRMGKILSFEK